MHNHLEYSRKYRTGTPNLIKKLFKLCIAVSLFLSFIYTLLSWQPWVSWRQDNALELSGSLSNGHNHDRNKIQTFQHHWCRMQKLRVDWEALLSPCAGNTHWGEVPPQFQNQSPTDPMASYIYYWDINPAGEFTRFFIQSQAKDGTKKLIGGDGWRVHISGPAYIAPNVIDLKNGSYEVLFLAMEPGVYQVEVMLDYTLCNGLRDPPADWFIKGNSQGKNQRYPDVDKSRDYILTKLWGNSVPVDITIPPALKKDSSAKVFSALAKQAKCDVKCNLLWDGFGRWLNGIWVPFISDGPLYRAPHIRKGMLYFYGDSVMDFFGMSLRYKRICRVSFTDCRATYNWVYPVLNYTLAKTQTDNLDFHKERVLESVRGVLTSKEMDDDSVFIMNFGLHYVESINFTSYRELIDGLVQVINEKYLDPSTNHMKLVYDGRVIWKTTTAINKQRATNINLGHRRFLTYQRVLLFNAYATWAMCQAGIPVLDVYPMSDSYPWGTGTHGSRIPAPNDVVHYSNLAFKAAEDLLEEMFSP